jgi:hypothetical protein
MKIIMFWNVTPYSPIEVHQRLRYYLILHGPICRQADNIKSALLGVCFESNRSSEKSVNFYQTAWRHILITTVRI